MKIEFSSIGYVRNSVEAKKDVNWGNEISELIINKEYEKGLIGLDDFSHIIVVYYLDKANFNSEKHLIRKPQGRDDLPLVGILSQRAKDRPNPIGITTVKLTNVKENIITVKGLDAIDNSPILDIKPYYPIYDCKTDALVPDWVNILMKHYF